METITTWYNALDPVMRTYWGIAIFASLIFLIQMVMTFIGIGDADDFAGLNLLDAAFLDDGPDHCVGDQVARVGFFGPVAGSLVTVQQDFGGGEYRVVFRVHFGGDFLAHSLGGCIHELEAVQLGTEVGRDQEIAFESL